MEAFEKGLIDDLFEINNVISIVVKKTNFAIYDFDFRQYFDSKSVYSQSALNVVLRIGAIKNYQELYHNFKDNGLQLINSIEQHDTASLLPNWYPKIENYTARSKWYSEHPTANEITNEFDFPIFIKGERQTNRHKRSLSVAENKVELETILAHWKEDPILNWQKVICREYVKLEKIDTSIGDKLQFSKEYRIFLWKNKVVGIGQYWIEARQVELTAPEKKAVIQLAEEVAQKVGVPFLVIDIAQKESGEWIVIELNDAQESGYAGVQRLNLWENIVTIEKSIQ